MRSTIHAATIRGLGVAMICSAALLTFNPAFAAVDDSDVPRVTVRFGDLDLSKPQGAETLYRRIRAAAEQVCAPLDGRDLAFKMRARACVGKAVADAVKMVDKPALLALYNAKHRRPPPTVAVTARRTGS